MMREPIADYIHRSKYARWMPEHKRRESYRETVERSRRMHVERFPQIEHRINEAFDLVHEKKVLPSMRSMQFAGKAIDHHHARMYNCSFTLADRPRVFAEAFYLLLCGCGVGFSVQRRHTEKLPHIYEPSDSLRRDYYPRDSIEGWADALDMLIGSYMNPARFAITFHFDKIRPEGAPLKTSGGRAPGPQPLEDMLIRVEKVLKGAVGRQLEPIEVHDIMCHMALAVLAGGIRRSSLISLFDKDDEAMLSCKTPEHFRFPFGDDPGLNAQRQMANNSAVLIRDETTRSDFFKLLPAVQHYGEPGFVFVNDPDHGTNPCGEIGLNPVTDDGRTGFAFCNLTEINMDKVHNHIEFMQAAEAAALVGTLQAAYTDFGYLGPESKEIAERDALLGVSLTGMADNPRIAFGMLGQQDAAAAARIQNWTIAEKIGINRAKRVTCVKPSGTASLALGCVGSGIHPHHAEMYFRRITANPNEPVAQAFRATNPHMVEDKPNGDWCITFPVKAPHGSAVRKHIDWEKFLDMVFSTYESWVKPGTAIEDDGLTHNVSCTVSVPDGCWDLVWERVWANRDRVAAMSFLPEFSDKGIPYMPRETVVTDEDYRKFDDLVSRYREVEWPEELEDFTEKTAACEGGICSIAEAMDKG